MFNRISIQKLVVISSLLSATLLLSSCKECLLYKAYDDCFDGRPPVIAPPEKEIKLIPLPVKLPAAIKSGMSGPHFNTIPNMEKPSNKPRPIFYVPKGTTNVALGKPVTATDMNPTGGPLSKIVDGDMRGKDGSWIELGLFEQHVTVDLGARHEIYAILIWHYFKYARVYYDVVVQTAGDPDFTTNVTTLFNNDIDNTHGLGVGTDKNYVEKAEGKLIDTKGVKGRYVRFYSTGNSGDEMNHYIEVAVFGKPVK